MEEMKTSGPPSIFDGGERQALITGMEQGRHAATRLCQLLVASVQQKYERAGDAIRAQVAQDICDILFNYNWGMNGERPAMPGEPDKPAPGLPPAIAAALSEPQP